MNDTNKEMKAWQKQVRKAVSKIDVYKLWIAVVNQALEDFYADDEDISSDAATWLFTDNKGEYLDSFRSMSSILGIDIEVIRSLLIACDSYAVIERIINFDGLLFSKFEV